MSIITWKPRDYELVSCEDGVFTFDAKNGRRVQTIKVPTNQTPIEEFDDETMNRFYMDLDGEQEARILRGGGRCGRTGPEQALTRQGVKIILESNFGWSSGLPKRKKALTEHLREVLAKIPDEHKVNNLREKKFNCVHLCLATLSKDNSGTNAIYKWTKETFWEKWGKGCMSARQILEVLGALWDVDHGRQHLLPILDIVKADPDLCYRWVNNNRQIWEFTALCEEVYNMQKNRNGVIDLTTSDVDNNDNDDDPIDLTTSDDDNNDNDDDPVDDQLDTTNHEGDDSGSNNADDYEDETSMTSGTTLTKAEKRKKEQKVGSRLKELDSATSLNRATDLNHEDVLPVSEGTMKIVPVNQQQQQQEQLEPLQSQVVVPLEAEWRGVNLNTSLGRQLEKEFERLLIPIQALVRGFLARRRRRLPVWRKISQKISRRNIDCLRNYRFSPDTLRNFGGRSLENFSPYRPRIHKGTQLNTPTPKKVIGRQFLKLQKLLSSPLRSGFQRVTSADTPGNKGTGGDDYVTPVQNFGCVTPDQGSNSNNNVGDLKKRLALPVPGPSDSNSISNINTKDSNPEKLSSSPLLFGASGTTKDEGKSSGRSRQSDRSSEVGVDTGDVGQQRQQLGIQQLNPQGEVATGVEEEPVEGGQEEEIGGQHQVEPTGGADSVVQPTWEELSCDEKASLTHIKCDLGIRDKHAAQEKTTIPLSDELWNSVPEDSDAEDSDTDDDDTK